MAALNEKVTDAALVRIFYSIYSDSACAPLESQFCKGYQEAVEERLNARQTRNQLEVVDSSMKRVEENAGSKVRRGISARPLIAATA